jgi:hypothetical protein
MSDKKIVIESIVTWKMGENDDKSIGIKYEPLSDELMVKATELIYETLKNNGLLAKIKLNGVSLKSGTPSVDPTQ